MATHNNRAAAAIDPTLKGKVVKPHRERKRITVVDTGERKAKQLQPGNRVKPLVNGQPHGGTRIVGRVERENDGAIVLITWRNGYTASRVAAAQRFVDVTVAGLETTEDVTVASFQEVR